MSPLEVKCSSCGAVAGELCRTPAGRHHGHHAVRIQAARNGGKAKAGQKGIATKKKRQGQKSGPKSPITRVKNAAKEEGGDG